MPDALPPEMPTADGISIISDGAHPDSELLALCDRLRAMQAEWQRLWKATVGTPNGGPEDQALSSYSDQVWPGLRLAPEFSQDPYRPEDQPGRLLKHRATTPAGTAAKAAAVVAMQEAACWCDLRNDSWELADAALRDAAGGAYVPVGEEATHA